MRSGRGKGEAAGLTALVFMLMLGCRGGATATPGEPTAVTDRLALGYGFACELADDGSVACWGNVRYIDLMRQGLAAVQAPIRGLFVHSRDACAVASDGRLSCWDDLDFKRKATRSPVDVSIDLGRSCVVAKNGRVRCWWRSSWLRTVRRTVRGVSGAVQVDGNCARNGRGEVLCWDRDRDSDLRARPLPGVRGALDVARAWVVHGDGSVVEYDQSGSPRRPAEFDDVVDVETDGGGHVCVRRMNGRVLCRMSHFEPTFVEVPGVRDAVELRIGNDFACARTRGGEVRCWGDNLSFELGDAAGGQWSGTPRQVMGLPVMTHVQVGTRHACAWGADRQLWCWGNGAGMGAPQWLRRPPRVIAGDVRGVMAGNMTYIERSPGIYECLGQIPELDEPLPDPGMRHVAEERGMPARVRFADATQFSFEGTWGCGAGPGGVRCFGIPLFFEESRVSEHVFDHHARDIVVALPRPGVVRSLAVAGYHACAAMDDGAVLCWGSNNAGQLDGHPAWRAEKERVRPIVVPRLPPMVHLTAGGTHTCGLTANGETWCWGGLPRPEISPAARVPGVPLLVALAAGSRHDCGVDAQGAVWCWGRNDFGQLGRGTRALTDAREQPGPVQGLGDVVALQASGATTCALDRAGAVWCWGENRDGQVDPTSPPSSNTALPVTESRRERVKPPR